MHAQKTHLPFVILFLLLAGCAPKFDKYISQYKTTSTNTVPDYNDLFYWAAHPSKKDPSDSVPKPLLAGYKIDSSVDVFFIYPTTLTDQNDPSWNAGINDPAINAKTDYSPLLYQASVFNEYRIFSPRYRQAHVRAYFTTDTARAKAALDLAYHDIKTAFEYYMQHYNNGRPIIIASHSQGSTHAQKLLKEFFDNKPLQKKLVAAYVLGMYIPDTLFTKLTICKDTTQTGCVLAWRTYKENYEPDFVVKEHSSSLVTNPVSWNNNNNFADHNMNEGSILLNFNKIKKHLVGAEIHNGILWVGRLHVPFGFIIRRKNFHIGDVNLFYMNIREDARRRVHNYGH